MSSSDAAHSPEDLALYWRPLTPAMETGPGTPKAPEADFVVLALGGSGAGDFTPLGVALAEPQEEQEGAWGQQDKTAAPEEAEAVPPAVEEDAPQAPKAEGGMVIIEDRMAVVEQEAYEKGFLQGEKDGFELGEKKVHQQVEQIGRLLDAIGGLKQTLLATYEKEIMAAVCAVAEKVVHRTVQLEPAVIQNVVLQALELAADKEDVRLRVNPADHAAIEKFRPEIFSAHGEMKSVVVTADPAVARGGCILETPRGNVDASLQTRLRKVQEAVFALFGDADHG